ncbi:basic proline-rich protein-like [Diceros bicornis minor]|uniref:basic proline-rich protein-like n=1 Tax=Diceros bicornis minor TaxID=77932 RepID=UPI0026F2920C|nr:basic proline-rich protein-like [Diceros bicornis minor]
MPPRSLCKFPGAPGQATSIPPGGLSCLHLRRGRGSDSPSWMGVSPGAATAQPPPLGPRRRRAPPADRACPPSPPTPRCRPGPALGIRTRPPRAARGGGRGAVSGVGAATEGPASARSGPASLDPGSAGPAASPRPPAPASRGGPPQPRARAHAGTCRPPAARPLRHHSPGAGAAEPPPTPGWACAPRATQSDGPGAARRRRVGTGSAAAGPAPPAPTGGHFRSRGVERGSRRGRACGGVLGYGPGPTLGDPGPPCPDRRPRPHPWGPRRPPPLETPARSRGPDRTPSPNPARLPHSTMIQGAACECQTRARPTPASGPSPGSTTMEGGDDP